MRDEAEGRGGGNDMTAEGAGAGWEESMSAGMCREGAEGMRRGHGGAERGGTGRRDGAEETLSGAKREKGEGREGKQRRSEERDREGEGWGAVEWGGTKQRA